MKKIFLIGSILLGIIVIFMAGNIYGKSIKTEEVPYHYVETSHSNDFAGVYINQDGETIICIKEGFSEETMSYISSTDSEYKIVDYNLSELNQAFKSVEDKMNLYNVFGVALDIEHNKIKVMVLIDTELHSDIESLVDSGIAYVVYHKSEPVFTIND